MCIRDRWNLDPPDIQGLIKAAQFILDDQDRFRKAARERAETAFDLEVMVENYLRVLFQG
jgi:glycosyltransferase involved in cell wall biosynthesis